MCMFPEQIERLKWLRDLECVGVREAARRYGINENTYKAAASGQRRLSIDTTEMIANHHRVSRGWLLFGEGGPWGTALVPLVGTVGAGQAIDLFHDMDESQRRHVETTLGDETSRAYEVVGSSMLPVARDGDVIVVGTERRDLTGMVGREGVFVLESDQRYFKVLERGDAPGRYTLLSYNSEPIRNVEVHAGARLLGIVRKNNDRVRIQRP